MSVCKVGNKYTRKGYIPAKVPRWMWEKVFLGKRRPAMWWQRVRVYYSKNHGDAGHVVIKREPNLLFKLLLTVGFPFMVLWAGLERFPELLAEYRGLYNGDAGQWDDHWISTKGDWDSGQELIDKIEAYGYSYGDTRWKSPLEFNFDCFMVLCFPALYVLMLVTYFTEGF